MVWRYGGRAARLECTGSAAAAISEAGAGSDPWRQPTARGLPETPPATCRRRAEARWGERVDYEEVSLHAASSPIERRRSCGEQGGCANSSTRVHLCGKLFDHHENALVRHACPHQTARLLHHCTTSSAIATGDATPVRDDGAAMRTVLRCGLHGHPSDISAAATFVWAAALPPP